MWVSMAFLEVPLALYLNSVLSNCQLKWLAADTTYQASPRRRRELDRRVEPVVIEPSHCTFPSWATSAQTSILPPPGRRPGIPLPGPTETCGSDESHWRVPFSGGQESRTSKENLYIKIRDQSKKEHKRKPAGTEVMLEQETEEASSSGKNRQGVPVARPGGREDPVDVKRRALNLERKQK